jgi:hypothetical protein
MNEIFIILDNKYSFVELIFKDYKNEFIFYDQKYNFEFINHNKLKIFIENEVQILETVDSFLFTNNISKLISFNLITLNHNEWFDQAILNYCNNKIIRIKDRNQHGTFEIEENKLKINWNHWGEEIFVYYDENVYNQVNLVRNDVKKDILVFMHVCNLNNGIEIYHEQLNKIKKSKFYDNIKKIYVCWVGNYEKISNEDENIEIIHLSDDITYYEFLTINKIKELIETEKENMKILYIHNKGTRKAGNEKVIKSWRALMEYFLIEKGLYCISKLNYFDTIGCNIINETNNGFSNVNEKHCYHYSGNFWWSNSSYIKSLKKLEIDKKKEKREEKRFQCENWLLSNLENKNIGVIYQNNTNIHPYHRLVFDDYRNKKLFIKKIKINLN